METKTLVGIFVRLCIVLFILSCGCLVIVEPSSPEFVISCITASINLLAVIVCLIVKNIKRRKTDEKLI